MTSFQRYLKIFLPFILSVVLVTGIYIGGVLNKEAKQSFQIKPQQNKLNSVINFVQSDYVDSVDINKLIEEAIPELISNLDPHSVYIPAKDVERVNEPLVGNFDGIGVQFRIQNDTIAVVKTIINGPSYRVGIMDGDRIIKINDTIVAGIKISETTVMKKLRGKKGTKVNVSILRRNNSDLIDFTITRDKIPLYSVDLAYMVNDSVGYVKISKFAQTTYKEFVEAIKMLKSQNMRKIIVDLRGNSGGYLNAATNIADEFLEDGKMIVYTEGKARQKEEIYATSRGLCEKDEVIILIDEWAASASEILAGAIQDNDRGLIIGRRSYGKGLVQEQLGFRDGSSLRLTIARYYTPTGRCIQKPYNKGLQNYYDDIGIRYHNGEFEEKDSIHFSDSLKYTTPGGKIVYGGGGIMPDIFVPLDTTGTSEYLSKVSRKGILYNFAFEYADEHREKLSKYVSWKSLNNFLSSQNILPEFIIYASKNGIKKNNEQIKQSEEVLNTQLNALIARNILDDKGFYPIILSKDKTFLRAVEEMKKNSHRFNKLIN
ncbi:MAG: S41 family peptidase [Chlorobi bacterium]|nr:S41 family peptidase [Chlorobiota bacterium]